MKSIARLAAVVALTLAPVVAAAEAPRTELQLGRNSSGSVEAYLRYIGTPSVWVLQPVYGVSWSSQGEGWAGVGLAWTWRTAATGPFLRASVMPGLYRRGDGRDLGGSFIIRSGLDLGYTLHGGATVTLSISHRSNAGLKATNTGMNTISLGLSIPFR